VRARRALRVAVPADLLALRAEGGHGKIWSRVLEQLRARVAIQPVGRGRRLGRGPHVVLANGHADLPPSFAPLVVQVHEAGWFDPALRALLEPAFYEHIASRTATALDRAAHVIALSESARRDIVRDYGLDAVRVHAVPPGVDAAFRPGLDGGRALVARARGGRDDPYVLFAAALHPRKNLAALREAVAALAAEGLPHVLVVAGGPAADRADPSELERAARAELPSAPGRVVRVDRPSDDALAALMAGADAFCLPSLYEGFGLTALEAMACGTPVVVSDRGSLPEVVGDAALVAPPTGEGVRDALRRLLTDRGLAGELGRAGAERARTFTWERTAAGWLAVLREAAADAA
jgi:glycosyltransferase involved in cell wall biosynthesis